MTLIRDYAPEDRNNVLCMVERFYSSAAVSHPIPLKHYADAYSELCCGGSGRLRGLIILQDGRPAGFCTLAFTYSTEAGGTVVLVEDIYIDAAFRGQGLGKKAILYILDEYRGKAARIRLEVEPANTGAARLYQRLGFKTLPYKQMTLEEW